MLCPLFIAPMDVKDVRAVLVDTFNLEVLPYRDLAVNCGNGVSVNHESRATVDK
jgi:hypothetical protein